MTHPARVFTTLLIVFVTAMAAFSFWGTPNFGFYIPLVLFTISMLIIFWKNQLLRNLILIFLVILISGSRLTNVNNEYTQRVKTLEGDSTINVSGYIVDEPKITGKNQIITLDASERGQFQIFTNQFPSYQFGEYLTVNGKLGESSQPNKNRSKNVVGFLNFPEIQTVDYPNQKFDLKFRGILIRFRKRMERNISLLLPEPAAGLLNGIIFGTRVSLSTELISALSVTGTMHIIALSGYNITIIAVALKNFFKYSSRNIAFWAPVLGIVVFVLGTGGSASVIRAAIMGILLVWAGRAGRQPDVLNAILFSAAVMAFLNPYIILYDIGFQLSFAATFGIFYLAPRFDKYFTFLGPVFGPNTSATIAAQILTLPLISIYFGRISLISPVANLVILPLIPYVMLLGFAVALLGFASFYLAKIFAQIVWLILNYMINISMRLAGNNIASINYQISNWQTIFAFYIFLIEYMYWSRRNGRKKFA